jgi:hypothetical protein
MTMQAVKLSNNKSQVTCYTRHYLGRRCVAIVASNSSLRVLAAASSTTPAPANTNTAPTPHTGLAVVTAAK